MKTINLSPSIKAECVVGLPSCVRYVTLRKKNVDCRTLSKGRSEDAEKKD